MTGALGRFDWLVLADWVLMFVLGEGAVAVGLDPLDTIEDDPLEEGSLMEIPVE